MLSVSDHIPKMTWYLMRDIRMRKFGENPKRAGTVSVRLGLNARWALNVSSPLERSEKVGSESREMFSLIASQETYFWEFDRGCGDPLPLLWE